MGKLKLGRSFISINGVDTPIEEIEPKKLEKIKQDLNAKAMRSIGYVPINKDTA